MKSGRLLSVGQGRRSRTRPDHPRPNRVAVLREAKTKGSRRLKAALLVPPSKIHLELKPLRKLAAAAAFFFFAAENGNLKIATFVKSGRHWSRGSQSRSRRECSC